jgi:uncharacterized membrane protein YoaK (UPF0700 family)
VGDQATSTKEGSSLAASTRLQRTLLLLTFTTGLVDAVSFIGLGNVFTANMTGNVAFIGFALAGAQELSAFRSVLAIVAFMLGAALAGRLATAMKDRTHRAWLGRAAAAEVVCLGAAVGAGLAYDYPSESPRWALLGIIAFTACAMGFRNATVLKLGDPDLKTTVLTLTLTGIAADSRWAGGANPRAGRRVASVVALGLGAVVGAALLRSFGVAAPLGVMAGVVVLATGLYLRHPESLAVGWGRRPGGGGQPEP